MIVKINIGRDDSRKLLSADYHFPMCIASNTREKYSTFLGMHTFSKYTFVS